MSEIPKRLRPTAATTRGLLLYSGNQCAHPGCGELLLLPDGTWACDVAHIHGVMPGSARHDPSRTNEANRDAANLLLLCLKHHRKIDNPMNEDAYPADVVERMKADHERRYREAIPLLEARVSDATVGLSITYPENLGRINDEDDPETRAESIGLVTAFANDLSRLPPIARKVLALLAVHGDLLAGYGLHRSVVVAPALIKGILLGISREDYHQTITLLRRKGYLETVEDEYGTQLQLVVPDDTGWDIFATLKKLAGNDRDLLERALVDLDLSVLDH